MNHPSSPRSPFVSRHIGPTETEQQEMLKSLGCSSLQELVTTAAPKSILNPKGLDLPQGLSEAELLKTARQLADQNQVFKSYIGQGYYDTFTPPVIQRNILENPGWYTAYTPYQAEISQGRMEALLNFQTMVMELTGMSIANASLLDEGTAIAEAMTMASGLHKSKTAKKIFVDENLFDQSLEVLETRAEPLGIELVRGNWESATWDESFFAAVFQYPGADGALRPGLEKKIKQAQSQKLLTIVTTDLLALCSLKPPGEMGVDIVVGSSQRFGVPMGYGGPHAAFIATREEFKRQIPGRIIGVSKDQDGKPALRLALQTREQHIRREKATSNICTAQVLLAVMASMYAVYHGPEGLKRISQRVHALTAGFAEGLKALGYTLRCESFFDTLSLDLDKPSREKLKSLCESRKINLNFAHTDLRISFDETKTQADAEELLQIFSELKGKKIATEEYFLKHHSALPSDLKRNTPILKHEIFQHVNSETEMLRYIRKLESKDLSLTHSMIPLGSCTMKLNATTEMMPVTWAEFGKIHPFAPVEQAKGYLKMIRQLEGWLSEITGFAGVSLQPNAGSQGEYAGLLVIRKYLQEKGQSHRNVCLIPSSAHGTNPASAVMAGMKVVVVQCDEAGNIDVADLKQKAEDHKQDLSALMITYPSTHGVFEEGLSEICKIVHENGGQVYMDGANMNALVGISKPGQLGPDVCHLNLHKTFCIPHGGGGPGIGPIGVAAHLKDYLPTHRMLKEAGPEKGISAISAAPFGSASILPISWAYIAMMGREGLRKATEVAILNANYIAEKLRNHFDILYTGPGGRVAHECILDVRKFKDTAGITVDDIAKRLMDYGFHAPTMSWPVAGTLMVEPTESESKAELDRFIEAMISIKSEIEEVTSGKADPNDNVLKNAPHPAERLLSDNWSHKYSRETAAYPLKWVRQNKFWPSVGRVDNAYGDKNLVCSCPPLEAYS